MALQLVWEEHRAGHPDGYARGDGRLDRLLRSLERVELLILDDWGLSP